MAIAVALAVTLSSTGKVTVDTMSENSLAADSAMLMSCENPANEWAPRTHFVSKRGQMHTGIGRFAWSHSRLTMM